MTIAFSYSGITIDSSELLDVKISRNLQINSQETMALYEITQAGVMKAIRFQISAKIRNNANSRLQIWLDKFAEKPLFNLVVLDKNWGDYHFESIDFEVENFENTNKVIGFKMTMNFTQSVNF